MSCRSGFAQLSSRVARVAFPILHIVVGLLVLARPMPAQEGDVTLLGLVANSQGWSPIPAVAVSVEGTPLAVRTRTDGTFELTGIPTGTHILNIERAGFASRSFRLTLADTLAGEVDLGPVTLQPREGPKFTLTGSVRDSASGAPVVGVGVALNGAVLATTNDNGTFTIPNADWGSNLLQVNRIGYAPYQADLVVPEGMRFAELDLKLMPLPFRLEDVEVVVEEDRTIYAFGPLKGFYQRREMLNGDFFTRLQIEIKHPRQISDFLGNLAGVRADAQGRVRIRGCGQPPAVYLDGLFVPDLELDLLVVPQHIEAMEVYRGGSVPPMFRSGTGCGAVVIWTRNQ